jgi:hypothetical protein
MDPLTAALSALLPIIGTEVVKAGVKDAYHSLKAAILKKWGSDAPLAKAITALEEDPTSQGQAAVLKEKVASSKAMEVPEVTHALSALVKEMKAAGIGGDAVASIEVNISGGTVQGAVGVQNLKVDTMNFGTPPKE